MRVHVLSLLTATAAAAVLAVGVVPAVAAPTTPAAPAAAPSAIPDTSAYGAYYAQSPQRIFDSRSGGHSRLGQGRSFVLPIAVGGVSRPSAVVLNLTVVNPSTSGYLTAYPAGQALPRTSSINFAAGRTTANLVTVPVSASGSIVVYNGLGTTDVIVDQLGGYSADTAAARGNGGGYHPQEASRFVDTRSDGGGPLQGGYYFPLTVGFGNGTGPNPIRALALNVTVTNPRADGYLTAWNGVPGQLPRSSTLNFTRGATVSNYALVPTSRCTNCDDNSVQVGFFNGSGADIDVIVDAIAYFDDGSVSAPFRFKPLSSPVRIVDSRTGLGLHRMGANQTQVFTPPTSVAGDPTIALDANITLVKPTASTYLTLWPQLSGVGKPRVSAVNSGAGQVVSNHAIQEVGNGNRTNIYNFNGGTDVVIDVSGTFEYLVPTGDKQASGTMTPGSRTVQRAVLTP